MVHDGSRKFADMVLLLDFSPANIDDVKGRKNIIARQIYCIFRDQVNVNFRIGNFAAVRRYTKLWKMSFSNREEVRIKKPFCMLNILNKLLCEINSSYLQFPKEIVLQEHAYCNGETDHNSMPMFAVSMAGQWCIIFDDNSFNTY